MGGTPAADDGPDVDGRDGLSKTYDGEPAEKDEAVPLL